MITAMPVQQQKLPDQPQLQDLRPSLDAYFMSMMQGAPVPMMPMSPGASPFPFFMGMPPLGVQQSSAQIMPTDVTAAALMHAKQDGPTIHEASPQAHIIHAQLQAHLLAIAQHHAAQQLAQQQ
jgi:hypothetical protein